MTYLAATGCRPHGAVAGAAAQPAMTLGAGGRAEVPVVTPSGISAPTITVTKPRAAAKVAPSVRSDLRDTCNRLTAVATTQLTHQGAYVASNARAGGRLMSTPVSRRAHAQVAAHTRWATTDDRQAATAPARRGLEAKWAREIDPTGVMQPTELNRRIASMRAAHMAKMRLARAKRASQNSGERAA